MRKRIIRPRTLLTLFTAVPFIIVCIVSFIYAQPGQQPQKASNEKRKTLREIAQERDAEVIATIESEAEHGDLRALAKESNAIVLARITEAKSSFTESGDFIETFYTVDVQRVLKDTTWNGAWQYLDANSPPAPLITPLRFVRAGGVVRVNGHQASVKVKGFELLKEGADYIFFLNWSTYGKIYTLAGGISGVVSVEDNSRVKPLASDKKARLKYDNEDLEAFINEVLREQ